MDIKLVVTGSLEENCYVLTKKGNCLVVDPGADYNKIKEAIGENKVLGVLITHSHFDHIGALRNFLVKRSVKIFKKSNLEEKTYNIEEFSFKVVTTPGHCSDSVSFYFEESKSMFVGDFIFKDTIGRCDLPTGDFSLMKDSIKKIKEYPDETVLYPGHGEITTLGREKLENIYIKNN